MTSVKQMVGAKVLDQAFAYLEGDPVENIPRLAKLIRRVPGAQRYAAAISQVDGIMADEKNPWRNLILRAFHEISPGTVKKFTGNFIINACMLGSERAKEALTEKGVRTPWAILMDPTSACNLRCIGCWAAEYKKSDSLSLETLDRIIREGKEIGTYFYIYSGGEPLMRKDDLIRLAEAHQDCMFLSFTNATLVDDKFAADLARVGNFALAISVEGEGPATDGRRGKGVYDQVIAAMDRLRKAKAPFGFSTCYHAKNVDQVADEGYLDFLIEKGCLFGWYFTYIPCGSDAQVDLVTPPDKRALMYDRVHDWRSRKPIFLMDFWNDGEYVDGCVAGGRSYLHINAAGDVEPCAFIHYSDVNIKDVSLVEALKSPPFAAYQAAQPFNENHLRPCPLLDNPEALRTIVHAAKARSTQPIDQEDVDSLTAKCEKAAAAWAPVADALWEKVEPAYRMRKNNSQAKQKEALEKVSLNGVDCRAPRFGQEVNMRESNATTETRQRIIDYAIDQFWRYGYSGITIDEIAAELRISKATFYNFFKSKEDLVVEAARFYYGGLGQYPVGEIGSAKELIDELKGIMRRLVTALEQVDPRARRDIRTSVPQAWSVIQLLQHEAVNELMGRLLAKGQRNGILKPDLNIKAVAVLMTLSAESIINGEAVVSLGMDRMEAMQSFVDVFFGGLLAGSAAGGTA